MFTDNPEANKFAKKHLHAKIWQKSFLYVGIVGAVGGAFIVNPLISLTGGIIISTISYGFNNNISKNLNKAVMVYNQQW
jgi:hypothetical protein